ncbi:MAG TPA: 16S rRNA (guanine(527)-N(7))-methyltransferase RsmG [Bryobacteraceae bacterium]|nr:16S rRNA (guanine(527)-N(7))-methyltransferase RsmG [Bryobacteraceae bacterium]
MFPDLLLDRFPGLSASQVETLQSHFELMIRWNRSLNLTTITDTAEAVERHYCESLFLAQHLSGGRIVDIGSGAGFPGIPVAVLLPESGVTLVESHQRKAVFLRESTRSLPNVRVLAQRAEAVTEQFDWAISRAVGYADLAKPLRRLAPNAALLTGAETPPDKLGFRWNDPIPVPWGRERWLRVGIRSVSRET